MKKTKKRKNYVQELGKVSVQEATFPGTGAFLSEVLQTTESQLFSLLDMMPEDKEKLMKKDEMLKGLIDLLNEFRKKKEKQGWVIPGDLNHMLVLIIIIFGRIEEILKEIKAKIFEE